MVFRPSSDMLVGGHAETPLPADLSLLFELLVQSDSYYYLWAANDLVLASDLDLQRGNDGLWAIAPAAEEVQPGGEAPRT